MILIAGDYRMSGMEVYKYELPNDTFSRPSDGNDCYLMDGLPTLLPGLTDASPCYHSRFRLKLKFTKIIY